MRKGLDIASTASTGSEDEHCRGARHAGSPSHLLSRALIACRALFPVHLAQACLSALKSVALAISRGSLASALALPLTLLLGLALCLILVAPAGASTNIHVVSDVLGNYTSKIDGRLYFTSPLGQSWELITDINDPEITNKGDGDFHPFDSAVVEEAISQVSYPTDAIQFETFILPCPRRGILESSASLGEVFLSPGVLECSPELVHFTVVHELGHIIHRRLMPDENSGLWQKYRELRRITDMSVYNADAIHKNRPTEIFAEDFRFLFGSAAANYSGTIENGSLPLPSEIPGLKDFMLSLVNGAEGASAKAAPLALNSFPNPFNPVLNVNFTVGTSPQRLTLRIFDVGGRLVRTLVDEELPPGNYSAVWNGIDERGKLAASGIYFLRLEASQQTVTKKVILSR